MFILIFAIFFLIFFSSNFRLFNLFKFSFDILSTLVKNIFPFDLFNPKSSFTVVFLLLIFNKSFLKSSWISRWDFSIPELMSFFKFFGNFTFSNFFFKNELLLFSLTFNVRLLILLFVILLISS